MNGIDSCKVLQQSQKSEHSNKENTIKGLFDKHTKIANTEKLNPLNFNLL